MMSAAVFSIVSIRHWSAHLYRSLQQKQVSFLAVLYGKDLACWMHVSYWPTFTLVWTFIKPAYCNEANVNTFLHPLYRFFLLQMLSSRVCGPTSNGKTTLHECYHICHVSLIQYILCFVFLILCRNLKTTHARGCYIKWLWLFVCPHVCSQPIW
jgi:hypothetical protein